MEYIIIIIINGHVTLTQATEKGRDGDTVDMLRRLINCRIIIIINNVRNVLYSRRLKTEQVSKHEINKAYNRKFKNDTSRKTTLLALLASLAPNFSKAACKCSSSQRFCSKLGPLSALSST